MFGSRRREAVQVVVQNLRPLIGVLQHHHGLPAGFWQSPYVLGFLTVIMSLHLKIASEGRLSQTETGSATTEIWTAISNLNGMEITRHVTSLSLSSPKNAEFELGADNGMVFGAYSLKILRNEDTHPAIVGIKEKIPNADRGTIAGILYETLFIREVKARLG
jgi:hypothetical protein